MRAVVIVEIMTATSVSRDGGLLTFEKCQQVGIDLIAGSTYPIYGFSHLIRSTHAEQTKICRLNLHFIDLCTSLWRSSCIYNEDNGRGRCLPFDILRGSK